MRIKAVLGLGLILTSFALGADAQSLRSASGPAEVPPNGYTSSQYVDSRGCVFIRAGRSGVVRWVPRVTRNRQQMCGYRPSVGAAQRTVAVVPQTSAGVATQPRTVRHQQVVVQAQPTAQVRGYYQPRTAAPVTTTARTVGTTCSGVSAIAQQHMNSNRRFQVRCGPQQLSNGSATQTYQSSRGWRRTGASNTTQRQQQTVQVVQVPAPQFAAPSGYQPVWTDGRLNPMRGIGTLEGQIRSQQLWTNTVPGRLVRRETNRGVTYRLPGQAYPYIAYQQQYQSNGYYYRN